MKKTLLMGLIIGAALVQVDRIHAQATPPGMGTLHMHCEAECRVTMSRHGSVVGTFSFARDILVSGIDESRQVKPAGARRFEFHGDFQLRALPVAEAPPGGGPAFEIMKKAPVVINAQGVDVLLENIQ